MATVRHRPMRIWNDCSGNVITTELALVTSFLVAGTTAGLTQYRDAIHAELADLAACVQSVNQSYAFLGVRSPGTATAGSQFVDSQDAPVIYPTPCTIVEEAP